MVLVLAIFILPEQSPFGLQKEQAEQIRITMPFSALWFLVFGLPLFLWISEPRVKNEQESIISTIKQGVHTAKNIPGMVRFLIARMLYADALVVVYAFGGIYATNVFGFTQDEVIGFAIAINLTAGIGAAIMGRLEDRIGGFKTIRCSLKELSSDCRRRRKERRANAGPALSAGWGVRADVWGPGDESGSMGYESDG